MFKKNVALVFVFLMIGSQLAHAGTGDASGSMNVVQNLLDKFSTNSANWIKITQVVALKVFGTLAMIEIALKMRKVVLSGGEEGPIRIAGILMTSLMTWGFFLWAMQDPATVLGGIVKGFAQLGGSASGLGALNPSQMIGAGIDIALIINNAVSTWTALTSPSVGFVTGFTEICVVAGFGILGLQMFAAMLHYYLLLACAPILLAGGALSFTRDWAIKQFQGAVSTGIKIFVIYLIAGIVTSFVPDFKTAVQTGGVDNMAPLLGMLAAGILIVFLGFFAPSVASAIMGGTSSMSANEMAGFGASVAGAAVMGAGVALGGAQMLGKAATSGASAMGGLSNAAGSLGSMLGNATSAGGSMKEAFSTGPGGGSSGATSGAMDMAKRVGGDLPSGMSPISPQSKALLGDSGGGSGSNGSSGGGDKMPSTGIPAQGSQTAPSGAPSSGASNNPASGSSAQGTSGASGASGSSTHGSSGVPGTPGSSTQGASGVSANSTQKASTASGGTGASSGGGADSSGSVGGSAHPGDVDASQQANGAQDSNAAGTPSPAAGTASAGDASNAAIGGNQSQAPQSDADNGQKPPSKTQKARDFLDKTQQHANSVKGFIPEASSGGTMHINMQD